MSERLVPPAEWIDDAKTIGAKCGAGWISRLGKHPRLARILTSVSSGIEHLNSLGATRWIICSMRIEIPIMPRPRGKVASISKGHGRINVGVTKARNNQRVALRRPG